MKDRNWAHRRCRNLVWILAGTGLLAGLFVVTVMSWCLKSIRAERVQRDEVAKVSAEVLNSVDQWLSEGMNAANDFLAGKKPTLLIPVRQAKRKEIEQKVRAIDTYVDAKDLQRELAQFDKLVWDCRRFAQEVRFREGERSQAWETATGALRQLALEVRNETMQQVPSGHDAPAPQSEESHGSDRVDGLSQQHPHSAELAELAVLVERLVGVDNLEGLSDLEQNKVFPILHRLRRKFHAPSTAGGRPRNAWAFFEQSLVGSDRIADDHGASPARVESGLLSSCRSWLQLQVDRKRLQERSQERSERLRDFQAESWQRLNKLTDDLALNAAKNMFWAWSMIVLSAAIAAVLFLILSRQIAITIAFQVAEKDEQAKTLEKEVKERILAENERERLHAELQVSARCAGMAEVATGVLHNVGNVLNSVNVSANILQDSLHARALNTLSRVSDLLVNSDRDLGTLITEDERGKHIPALVLEISRSLNAERDLQLRELNDLVKNVEHIKTIVTTQQFLASRGGATERTSLAELVEDAVELNVNIIRQHGVRLQRNYDTLEDILIDKHQILQILVNLIKNGLEAMKDCTNDERVLSLTVRDEGEFIAVEVVDTGHGIAPEHFEQIFQLGFTTKEAGHGFGLHNSANVAQEAGGSLVAHSDGIAQGAKFVLRLPKNHGPKAPPHDRGAGRTGDIPALHTES